MEVKIAQSAGFCFGVKRAVNLVYDKANQIELPVYTYGPIIHNKEVVRDLEAKGVKVVEKLEDIAEIPRGIMVIRSHGISKYEYDTIEKAGFEIADATCPFVKKIHKLVSEYSKQGYSIIVMGSKYHPEVMGITGWVEDQPVYFIDSHESAKEFTMAPNEKAIIVSQTTFNYNKFQELVEIIAQKGYDIIVLNTICNATEERQTEARSIAREVDAMIVIGDAGSSNTQKLFEICKTECENTYYIQTSNDMDYDELSSINIVGITAGASTPNNIIEEVSKNVRNEL